MARDRLWPVLLGVLLTGLVSWQAALYARDWGYSELVATGQDRLLELVTRLRQRLDRYRFLPFLVSQGPQVQLLLREPGSERVLQVNRYLEQIGLVAGATALFVLDREGRALAYSQWREQRDFYLRSHAALPYFQQARNGVQDRYYTLQAAGERPAFYISAPIYSGGAFAGVAVVRIDLDRLGDGLPHQGEYLLAGEDGEVILSSLRRALGEQLPVKHQGLRRFALKDGTRVAELREERRRALLQSVWLDDLRWQLAVLTDSSGVAVIERNAVLVSLGGSLAVILLLMWLRERHLKNLSRRQTREALRRANRQLEAKVQARTRELEQAQEALLQEGKMAAIGRMSSAVVHQFNQPLTALTTYLAICRQRLQRGELQQAGENLDEIADMAGRMGHISRELKLFAYRPGQPVGSCRPDQVIEQALQPFRSRLREQGVDLHWSPGGEEFEVAGDALRLEQVVSNLVGNALEAMQSTEQPCLRITSVLLAHACEIRVMDNGPGVDETTLEQLFEPFFTTRPMGEGLGLGLAIVRSIVNDCGGTIEVESTPGAGCCFIIRLPLTGATG